MKTMDMLLKVSAAAVFFMVLSGPAHAYLDPVTGSLIVQGIVALIAGLVAGVKSVRNKVIGFFTRLFHRKDKM
jgi:hypothetical protein